MTKRLSLLSILMLIACQSTSKTAAPSAAVSTSGTTQPLSIMQGVTTENWTQITLHRERNRNYEVQFTTKDGSIIPETMIRRTQKDFGASEWVIDGFIVHDINPQSTYKMVVKENGAIVDQRTFSALEKKDKSHFAVVSCLDDFYKEDQKKMWADLAAKAPEFILAIGDNSYTDWDHVKATSETSSAVLWKRYSETRQRIDLYHLQKLIPVMATWDDHDYGVNDGDRRYKTRDESLAIFYSFFQQDMHDPGFNRGPGVSSIFKYGKQTFILLDDRFFRSPDLMSPICKIKKDNKYCQAEMAEQKARGADPSAKKDPETHFGKEQEKWLLGELKKARGPVYLISGDQWFGAYHPFESYEGNHPNSFKKFMAEVAKTKAKVVFIGGDRHNFEISKIEKELLGYETLEIISSPMHAKVYPSNWIEFPNKRQISGTANVFNYTIIDAAVADQNWNLKVQAYQLGGESIFDQSFNIPLAGTSISEQSCLPEKEYYRCAEQLKDLNTKEDLAQFKKQYQIFCQSQAVTCNDAEVADEAKGPFKMTRAGDSLYQFQRNGKILQFFTRLKDPKSQRP